MKAYQKWIKTILVNDETSTNEELKEHFIKEGKLTRGEADHYINQRSEALTNPLTFKIRLYKRSQ